MITTKRKEYDLIVSLGGNCTAASQLKFRGLRKYSLALDWAGMFSEKPLQHLPDCLRNHFKGFCRYENMYDLGEPRIERKRLTYKFVDKVTDYHFWHHFFQPLSDREGFERDRLMLERRFKRFYEKIAESKNVLFVLATPFAYDPHKAEEVLYALRETFANTTVELVVIQFAAPNKTSADLCDGDLHLETVTRDLDVVYDNMLTAPEWAWMDNLSLSDMTGKPKGLKKLIMYLEYKLWKSLGKSLLRNGIANGRIQFCKIEHGAMALAAK